MRMFVARSMPVLMLILFGACLFLRAQNLNYKKSNHQSWRIIEVKNLPEKREDCGFVEVENKFYLVGGRGIKPVEVFDRATNTWERKKNTPFEMHHFQAIVYKDEIYVVGGMSGKFPHEKPFENIFIYNPTKDEWREGAEIPANRRRGSGGAVVYKDKIYFVAGIQDGHYEGTVAWFDVFDPATSSWTALDDAPHARDHFQAVVIGQKLYAASGRRTSFKTKQTGDLTIGAVDVYDFKKMKWDTLQTHIPTQRAGSTSVNFKGLLTIIGGESVTQKASHNEVEVYDSKTRQWQKFPSLVIGRHDTQALVFRNKIYIVAGSANQGGGPDENTIEVLEKH